MAYMGLDAKITVCIFDVNGVLIDSNLANAQAMAQAFTDDPILRERIAKFYLTLTGIDRGIRNGKSSIKNHSAELGDGTLLVALHHN